jgi:hypothetical protein
MKKIEKELLLIDLENANLNVERKYKKLDTIIVYYLDEKQPTPPIPEPPKEEPQEVNVDEKTSGTTSDKESENKEENDKEEPNKEELDDLENTPKEDSLPQQIKGVYRKIMMKTHPDKTKGKPFEEEYEEFYKKAVKAKNDNDKAEILYIAYKLDIKEVFDVDDEHFGNVKFKIKTLEMKSTQLDNNPFWVWYHTDNDALKNIMIQQITKMRSGNKKR